VTCLRSQFSNTSLVAVRAAFIDASSVGPSGGSNGFDDRSISVLPRLKDDKAIGIADVDPPEEPCRKQSIHLNFWGIPILVACGCHEGYLMTDVVADPQVLWRQNGKRSFHSIYTAAASGRTHE
jgi:hypothetical protein